MKSRIDGVAAINWILIAGCGLTLRILFFVLQAIIPPLANALTQFNLPLPSFLRFMWSAYSFVTKFPGGILALFITGWMIWAQIRNPSSERILLRNTVIFTFLLTVCIAVLSIYAYEFVFTIPKTTGRAFLP
jgi:type II secretory pathway component PulF